MNTGFTLKAALFRTLVSIGWLALRIRRKRILVVFWELALFFALIFVGFTDDEEEEKNLTFNKFNCIHHLILIIISATEIFLCKKTNWSIDVCQ